MRNLDTLAAQTAQRIVAQSLVAQCSAAEIDNLATKSLGVLQENGVYAVTLFLYSRTGPDLKVAPQLRQQLLQFAETELVHKKAASTQADAVLSFVAEQITTDLDTLLLVKQIWEQTLIYVRYGAKAREGLP